MISSNKTFRSKRNFTVSIHLTTGETLEGRVYLKTDERLIDMLNDDRAFIPVKRSAGDMVILAKSTIASITGQNDAKLTQTTSSNAEVAAPPAPKESAVTGPTAVPAPTNLLHHTDTCADTDTDTDTAATPGTEADQTLEPVAVIQPTDIDIDEGAPDHASMDGQELSGEQVGDVPELTQPDEAESTNDAQRPRMKREDLAIIDGDPTAHSRKLQEPPSYDPGNGLIDNARQAAN